MVGEFWDDMQRAITDKREHFLGNVVFSEETEDSTRSIIDGQQRIVTTTLLLAAMKDVFLDSGEAKASEAVAAYIRKHDVTTFEDRARVKMNPDDDPYYKAKFVDGTEADPTRESHELLLAAYGFFTLKLKELIAANPSTWKTEFAAITTYLSEQARVVSVVAPTDADAFTVFETLNDRGAELTVSDLLKNLLFSRAKTEIDAVQQHWVEMRAVIEELGYRSDMLTFLRHFWSSRHGATRERDLYKAIKDAVKTKKDAVELARHLRDDASLYRAILSPTDELWKDFGSTAKDALAGFDKLAMEQIRPLLLAVYRHFEKKEQEKVARAFLNWSVRGLVAGVMGGGKAESAFCNAAIKVRDGSVKTVASLLLELEALVPKDAEFEVAMERYRTTTNSFARYLLYGLERKLGKTAQPELVPNMNVEEVNLEHVLPQRAKKVDWPNFAPETVSIFAYRLGNMTLLQKGPNGKIGNKGWVDKKSVLMNSQFKLNEIFKTANEWTSKDIEDRQKEFAKLAPSVWPLT